jgi:alpha-tubulin suppressor-like RCC1 family protein
MLMMPQSQYGTSKTSNDITEIIDNQNTEFSSSSLNISSPYNPSTFVEDASFFSSIRAESMTVGQHHSCIIYDDKTMTCSGYNAYGWLGIGYQTPSPHSEKEHLPVDFPAGVKIAKAVAGHDSTCAIDTNNHLWCWGSNSYWESGVGDTQSYYYSPERVLIDENETIIEIAIGNNHKCALTDSQQIYCWGQNNYGQTHFDTNKYGYIVKPTLIDIPTNVNPVSISTKDLHTCILSEIGAVYCWGYNGQGQLGDGTQTNRDKMVQVILPYSDPAVSVVTGYRHTCALLESGDLKCWGYNNYGQLGVKSKTPSFYSYPTSVLDLPIEPIDFDLGYEHTCALLKTQTIWCWGNGVYGQLGDGTNTGMNTNNDQGLHREVLQSYNSDSFYNSVDIQLGYHTSCSIFDSGRVGCWGWNAHGMHGDGSSSSRAAPYVNKVTIGEETSRLLFPISEKLRISPYVDGINFSVSVSPQLPIGFTLDPNTGAITHDGTGSLNTTFHNLTFIAGEDQITTPISIVVKESLPYPGRIRSHLAGISIFSDDSISSIASLSSTKNHVCINQITGEIYCWGDGSHGQLGTGSTNYFATVPQPSKGSTAYNPIRDTYYVVAATSHTCSLTNSGKVYCWGEGEDNRLGYGSTSDQISPQLAPFPAHRTVEMIATHESHNCAITDNGEVYCWGNNTDGQIGMGYKSSNQGHPTQVNLPGNRMAVAISVGDSFSCAVLDNGSITCWGGNDLGQLGDGTNANSTQPGQHTILGQNAITVSSGKSHSCAILVTGEVACWGQNNMGQLGDSSLNDQATPVIVQLPSSKNAIMIDVGISHTCAIMDDGSMYCWGLNADGQLGDGTNSSHQSIPVQSQLPSNKSAVIVAVGNAHTCILTNDSAIHCIGSNSLGQFGDSTEGSGSRSYNQTHWNRNDSMSVLYSTIGYSMSKRFVIAGWGDIDYSSSQLPNGYTLDSNLKIIQYSGLGQIGQNQISLFASNSMSNYSKNLVLNNFEHNYIEGRVDSLSYGAGFGESGNKDALAISAGYEHSCLVTWEYKMKCWGYSGHGESGSGSLSVQSTPVNVYDSEMKSTKAMDVGTYHVCSIDNESQLYCWGYNGQGQLGDSTTTTKSYPTRVTELTDTLQVSTSAYHTCALNSEWRVYCWGDNAYGQSGNSVGNNQLSPQQITGLGDSRPIMVSAGREHACILLENGTIGCLGRADLGAMGDGSSTETHNVIRWPNLPQGKSAISLSSGWRHVCAIFDDFSLYCWGSNNNGQIGNGNKTNIFTPIQILDSSYQVVGVTTGQGTTCSWLRNGSALCWGDNAYGQIGNGNNTEMTTPTWVKKHTSNNDIGIISMDNSAYQTCAQYDNGAVSCWGKANSYYGLGDATQTTRYQPSTFIYPTEEYDGSVKLTTHLNFVEGNQINNTIIDVGWNSNFSISGTLPNSITFNSSTRILSYDGTPLTPGTFNLQTVDIFGTRNIQIAYKSVKINSMEGRVEGPWLGNASANSIYENNQISMINAFHNHACFVEHQGDLYCWGIGNSGQLGTGSNVNYNYPRESNVNEQTNFSTVSTGAVHSCALNDESELLCWGSRAHYRLGDGSNSGHVEYPREYTSDSDIYGHKLASVSAGGAHTCAIKFDTTTWCWGIGNYGQIGDGNIYSSGIMPKQVYFPNNLSAISLTLGYSNSCAIVDTGAIYCWGRNNQGQLGVGNLTDQNYPTKVSLPNGRYALAIEAGDYHVCAILDDYSIKCWGQNTFGQLGNGNIDDKNSPTSVILSGLNNPIQISAGGSSTCALFDNGQIKCWGSNYNGELGLGSSGSSNSQQNSPQTLTAISHLDSSQVTVGTNFACALFHDGAPRCWGIGTSGQLGSGVSSSNSVPVLVKDYGERLNDSIQFIHGTQISIPIHIAGWDYISTPIGSYPNGVAWNNGTYSMELNGNLTVGNHSASVVFSNSIKNITVTISFQIIERIDPWSNRVASHSIGMSILGENSLIPIQIESGGGHTCFITSNMYNYCQGDNSYGQLGSGSYSGAYTSPYKIYNFEEPLESLSTGQDHTCGIDYEGTLYCWGRNNYGQIGNGYSHGNSKYDIPQKIDVDSNGNDLTRALQIGVGYGHSCGIFEDLELYCWGYNSAGQLGIGSQSSYNRPYIVDLPGNQRATDISLGNYHTCAITDNGSVYCWGDNGNGKLGDNSQTNSHLPIYVELPQNRKAIGISLAVSHSCAILDNNSVYCWGRNNYGQLGIGEAGDAWTPEFVELPSGSIAVQISTGEHHSCAVLKNGSAYCWGYNNYNQVEGSINNEQPSNVYSPIYVESKYNHRFVSISIGHLFTCGITENAEITCWGYDSAGRIISLNEGNSDRFRYVISEEYTKIIQPIGWGINNYSVTQLPQGMSMNGSTLTISSNANQSGLLLWNVNTLDASNQGTIDYDAMIIDRKQNSAPAWTNSISYKDANSEVSMIAVDANYGHSCGIDQEGKLYCWGNNGDGQLGDLSTNVRRSPTPVRFNGDDPVVKQVSVGRYNTCILTEGNRVMCWGDGQYGQNGQGSWNTDATDYDRLNPREVLLPWSSNATMISTGDKFACALMDDGSVECWGWNSYGQLGIGSTSPSYSGLPQTVMLPEDRFAISIDSTESYTCAVMDDGTMYCWGNQIYGNMGTGSGHLSGTASYAHTPIPVDLPRGYEVSFMSVGMRHSCAVMTDDSLWCWGRNAYGEIGVGNVSNSNSQIIRRPVKIDMQYYSPIVSLSAGRDSTCTLHDDGSLNCWGSNIYGQIGTGLIGGDTYSPISIQLDGGVTATSIASGSTFKCATTSDGAIQCWGDNNDGRLGDGTQEQNPYPGLIDMDLPTPSSILTYLEGETKQNENYVSGWNYTFVVSPTLPQGFELDENTGTIYSIGNSTFGVSRHNISAVAGPYVATVEITIAVIRDTDGDGIPDAEDYDDDDDGNLDSLDNCPSQAGTSTLGGYIGCPDSDGDGWADLIDPFDDDDTQWKDTDGDGYGDNPNGTTPDVWILDSSQWFDTDGDGYGDNEFGTRGDSCPTLEGYSTKDVYGCPDSDSDGWSDNGDAFPFADSQWADRDGDGWGDNQSAGAEFVDQFPSDGTQWNDTDGDGHGDNKYGTEGDWFPNDPERWADSDRDGVADEDDAFVNDATQSSDRDGDLYGDDPLGNRADEFPDDPTEWKDTDGDGVGNNADAFPFDPTQTTDRDGDGYGDNPLGSGADLFPDNPTQWEDKDGDGLGDNLTGTEADPYLFDFDNDGYNDSIDVLPNFYSPGDLDNDGVPDELDWKPSDYREWSDFDGDGKGDNEDPDDDGDGYADTDEIRQETDPYDKNDVPVESFEIVIPGTNVGLGAWDLIGMFGGIPLFSWIMFGFITRNKRCAKYEVMLNGARSRDELHRIALRWEYSLMLRMLGPHQGIRLERLRAELDDHFEKYEASFEYAGEDQTQLVEKEMPEIRDTVETEQVITEQDPIIQEVVEQPVQSVPDITTSGTVSSDGYEWLTHNGQNYYRLPNTNSEWNLWQG